MSDFLVATLSLTGCVFAASATTKLAGRTAYRSFRNGLGKARVMPGRLLPAVAVLLCAAETATAACLIIAGVLAATGAPGAAALARAALGAAAVLSAVLTGGVAAVIRRGIQARCSCFGAVSSRPLGRIHLIRNLGLLTVACAGLVGALLPPGHPAMAGVLLAAGSGAAGALVFIRWEDVTDLFMPIPGRPTSAWPARQSSREER